MSHMPSVQQPGSPRVAPVPLDRYAIRLEIKPHHEVRDAPVFAVRASSRPGGDLGAAPAMAPHQRWTQSDITELRSKVSLGATAQEIATALDRPLAAVLVMVSRLRLRVRD